MSKRALQSLVLGVLIGAAAGVGVYTFVYAKGASYLTNNPASCANCHVMNEQYDGWLKSSHHAVATCNDCHTPANFLGKYATKASNGFWHSFYFTTGGFHEPIQIKKRNLEITEQACQKCHDNITQAIATNYSGPHATRAGESVSCVRCHRSVGHTTITSARWIRRERATAAARPCHTRPRRPTRARSYLNPNSKKTLD